MKRIISVTSSTDNVGKSFLISNLVLALKRMERNPIFIDCNLSIPKMGYDFGLLYKPYTLEDFIGGKVGINDIIHSFQGVEYIVSTKDPNQLKELNSELFEDAVHELTNKGYDTIFIEAFPTLSNNHFHSISNEIIFVSSPKVPLIKDIDFYSKMVRVMGWKENGIVFNMVGKKLELSDEKIEFLVDGEIKGKVPFDKNVEKAITSRKILLNYEPLSPASLALLKLAAKLLEKKLRLSWVKLFFLKTFNRKNMDGFPYKEMIEEVLK